MKDRWVAGFNRTGYQPITVTIANDYLGAIQSLVAVVEEWWTSEAEADPQAPDDHWMNLHTALHQNLLNPRPFTDTITTRDTGTWEFWIKPITD
jgi:hypothetical protein